MELFVDISDIYGLEDELQEIKHKVDRQERLKLAILACLSESNIDAEVLKQLIAATQSKPNFNQVLWHDGYLYATNGHLAAKIEAEEQDTSQYCENIPGVLDGNTIKAVFDAVKPSSQDILMNPRYLKVVGEIFDCLHVSKVEIGFRGLNEPLTFIGEKDTGESVELVVMPLQTVK